VQQGSVNRGFPNSENYVGQLCVRNMRHVIGDSARARSRRGSANLKQESKIGSRPWPRISTCTGRAENDSRLEGECLVY